MPRIFLALNFSVAVTRKIAEEVERKKQAMTEAGFRVAWVPAANLHLTVKFLGSIREEAIEGVVGGLNRILPRHQPFEARAQALGSFPSLAKPNVLWVGVDSPAVAAFQKDVEGAMAELGFEKEERVFHPHVTVGRVKEARGDAAPIWTSNVDCGASLMTEVVVYESKTRSAGAEYIARARVPLGLKENR